MENLVRISQIAALRHILHKKQTITNLRFDETDGCVYFTVKDIDYLLTPGASLYMNKQWSFECYREDIKDYNFDF